jgi:hypothetical protein
MRESGYLVNILPLFGDELFWRYLKRERPQLFTKSVDALEAFPKPLLIRKHGENLSVDVIGVIKRDFPEAFKEIHEVRPSFDSDNPNPLQKIAP